MRPKGKLFALLAVFAAIGLVTATGAFTTVQADRTAEVTVAGDSQALLGIELNSSAPASSASDQAGSLTVNIGSNNGLNKKALTVLTPLVDITNNGNEAVDVNVSATTDQSGVSVDVVKGSGNTTFTQTQVNSGESTTFGLQIDIDDTVSASSSFTIDITIEATDADGS